MDELGQFPAKFIAVMDIILRKVRKSNRFLGGILVFCRYDIYQLLPIHMMTSFQFAELEHSVRAARDPRLRELQSLTRVPPGDYTDVQSRRLAHLIKTICTFVESFDDPRIPPGVMFVFGKKEPGRLRREAIVRNLAQTAGVPSRTAVDSESTYSGVQRPASAATSSFLDAKCKLDRTLYFSPQLVYQTTEVNGEK